MNDGEDEMPLPPEELPPGWQPGDLLPSEGEGRYSAPGLLALADREGRLAPGQQSAGGPGAIEPDSTPAERSTTRGADDVAASPGPGLHVDTYFQSTIDDMRTKSPTFDRMLTTLEQSPNIYTVHATEKTWEIPAGTPCDYIGGGCRTSIDPDKVLQLRYPIDPGERTEESGSLSPMTMERALAHEIAHQNIHENEHGWERVDFSESDAVKVENQVMREIDPSSPNRDWGDDRLFRPGKNYVPTDTAKDRRL